MLIAPLFILTLSGAFVAPIPTVAAASALVVMFAFLSIFRPVGTMPVIASVIPASHVATVFCKLFDFLWNLFALLSELLYN